MTIEDDDKEILLQRISQTELKNGLWDLDTSIKRFSDLFFMSSPRGKLKKLEDRSRPMIFMGMKKAQRAIESIIQLLATFLSLEMWFSKNIASGIGKIPEENRSLICLTHNFSLISALIKSVILMISIKYIELKLIKNL